ncbi:cyanoexosortase A [Altericista sp. CCNU0014]|uniref:cyanoexosortase A n=1 Tax=Altericista sp. CCNU0014 TaxID=3082949 RepID=UPI00384BB3A5
MKHLQQIFLGSDKNETDFRTSFYCLSMLSLIHFSLGIYLGKQAYLMMSLLLWAAIGLLLWDRRPYFRKSRDKGSFFFGCILVAALLVLCVVRPGEKILGFFPLFAFLGWFLIFVGISESKRYFKEFSILLVFGIPKLVPDTAFGLAPLTAKFSAFFLWYLGYPVSLQGIHIQVPKGGVEVVPACSGINLMTHMLSLSIIFLCVFPPQRLNGCFFAAIAVFLGFFMNGVRVAILAILSPPQFSEQFHYWHSASGASVFVLLTLAIYGLLYFSLQKPDRQSGQS